jgi:hypothetical protein
MAGLDAAAFERIISVSLAQQAQNAEVLKVLAQIEGHLALLAELAQQEPPPEMQQQLVPVNGATFDIKAFLAEGAARAGGAEALMQQFLGLLGSQPTNPT